MAVSAGKVVLVTGASGNLGAAISRVCAARGFTVAVHYRSNRRGAEVVVDSIERAEGRAVAFGADFADTSVSDPGQSLIDEVMATFGRIDAVVNNSADQTPIAFEQSRQKGMCMHRKLLVAGFAAAALVLAGCSSDSGDSAESPAEETAAAEETTEEQVEEADGGEEEAAAEEDRLLVPPPTTATAPLRRTTASVW
jgi:NAD(P)-dependent dehydrogenase (short-subunit alcohol dehydrogenase family)